MKVAYYYSMQNSDHFTYKVCLNLMHGYDMYVYHDVCFFPVALLLDSSGYIAIVRICWTTLVRLLHGFGLLPSEISGKMTITLDLTTIFAMLVVLMLSLCRATYHLFIKPLKLP